MAALAASILFARNRNADTAPATGPDESLNGSVVSLTDLRRAGF